MTVDIYIARTLYRKLLTFYPRRFQEQLGESMEQTFNDLCNEHQRQSKGIFGFLLRTFVETGIGIVQENLLLIKETNPMNIALTNFSLSAFLSFLLTLPFLIMEIVNRRQYNEDFPFVLFFVLWLNLFAVSLILLPIVRARRIENHDMTKPIAPQGNTLLTHPRSAAVISGILILLTIILSLLSSLRWEPMERLINGPNPEVMYLPGLFISVSLISIPITAGIIAGWPIVSTLRTGGSIFAHPLHLIIVVVISVLFAAGGISLIVDQWPCFVGVRICD